jgi:hypothetical protein
VASCCKCGDEPSGSCATELFVVHLTTLSIGLYSVKLVSLIIRIVYTVT